MLKIKQPANTGRVKRKSGPRRKAHKLAYTVAQLATLAGVGRTMIYAAIRDGRLHASKAGRRTIVTRAHAKAWLRSLPAAKRSKRDRR